MYKNTLAQTKKNKYKIRYIYIQKTKFIKTDICFVTLVFKKRKKTQQTNIKIKQQKKIQKNLKRICRGR